MDALSSADPARPIQLLICVPISAPPASSAAIITARAACVTPETMSPRRMSCTALVMLSPGTRGMMALAIIASTTPSPVSA